MIVNIILLSICAYFVQVKALDIPDWLIVCHKNDPEIDSCIMKSVEALKPKLKTGVPEYNIPSLEPLILRQLVAAEGTGGIRITANNVKAYGASNFIVQKIRVDLETNRFVVDILLPHLYIEGEYTIDGRVLLLPIRGNGLLTGNFTEATGACKIQAELVKDDAGGEHFNIAEFRLRIAMKKGFINLDNLFGGDPTLGQVINNAINNNFDTFITELSPLIEKALSEAFLEIANNFVRPYMYLQLFPS